MTALEWNVLSWVVLLVGAAITVVSCKVSARSPVDFYQQNRRDPIFLVIAVGSVVFMAGLLATLITAGILIAQGAS